MAMGEFPLFAATPLNWKFQVSGWARYTVVNFTFVPWALYWKSSGEVESGGRVACNEPTSVAWCDQIKTLHATAHFRQTGHPVARSIQPGDAWRYCYADEAMDDPEELELEGADLG